MEWRPRQSDLKQGILKRSPIPVRLKTPLATDLALWHLSTFFYVCEFAPKNSRVGPYQRRPSITCVFSLGPGVLMVRDEGSYRMASVMIRSDAGTEI